MTKTEFVDWRQHPVTEELIRMFTEVREAFEEEVLSGATIHDQVQHARTIGRIEGLNFFLKAEFEDQE